VRFTDAFINNLDLRQMGFTHAVVQETGRPPYHPGDLLKLYVYGYLNRVRSSRRLEKEVNRNVELMWLMRRLTPDFKTIADFRRDNHKAIQKICRSFPFSAGNAFFSAENSSPSTAASSKP
jgi:transposase